MSGNTLKSVAIGLLLAVLAVAALTARAVVDGQAQMKASDAAFDRGEIREAIDHARRAAVLYAPGTPHVQAAYERMIAIAVGAEAAGERELAQAAWRAVRGAALETRHLWVPRAAELARANENLARLATAPRGPTPPGTDLAAARERARGDLERDHAPAPLWIGVLALGFALAVVGLVWTAKRGVSPSGRFSPRDARWALVLFAVGAACWTVAVLRA